MYTYLFNCIHSEKGKWKWHEAGHLPGDSFAGRAKHAACLVPVGKKVVVFGGMTQAFVDGGDLLDSCSGTYIYIYIFMYTNMYICLQM